MKTSITPSMQESVKKSIPKLRRTARAARIAGRMNKLEAAYAAALGEEQRQGRISWFAYEPMKLRIGKACYYTPDFLVVRADGVLEVHETKGFWRDDARVKLRAVAERFPFVFVAVQRAAGGAWKREFFTEEEEHELDND